jgi:hypothetical protein
MINSGGSGTGVIGGGGAAGTLASGGGSGTTGSAGMMITGGGSGTTGTAGVGGDPGAAGTGAITLYPGAPEDCDAVYELHAHGQNGVNDTSKYSTSVNGNHYQCYYFKPPWGTDAVQGVQFASLVDNTKIVHHWILYGDDANSQNLIDGTISLGDCASGNNGNRYYITGWAPGGKDGNFPPDVGLQLPSSGMLTLEVHYLNDGSAQQDATGLKICVTHKPRANTAAIHWLGADANQQGTSLININASSAATVVGHCTPNKNQQIHVLSVSPHMHLTGVHQTTVLNHKSGGSVTLHDGPFDFHNQISYAVDPIAVMEPGDSITTTCSYQNTTPNKITYGEKTENEMCYNFVLAYPAGALSDGRKGCVPGYPCYPGGAKRCMDEGPP